MWSAGPCSRFFFLPAQAISASPCSPIAGVVLFPQNAEHYSCKFFVCSNLRTPFPDGYPLNLVFAISYALFSS
jgi:hypothetical protein